MLSAFGEINKGLVHVPAMWGGMWEADSLRTQARQLQSRLDFNFKTQVEEYMREDDAAVCVQYRDYQDYRPRPLSTHGLESGLPGLPVWPGGMPKLEAVWAMASSSTGLEAI